MFVRVYVCPLLCPLGTKFCRSDFFFAPKLSLGLDNFRNKFQNFPVIGKFLTEKERRKKGKEKEEKKKKKRKKREEFLRYPCQWSTFLESRWLTCKFLFYGDTLFSPYSCMSILFTISSSVVTLHSFLLPPLPCTIQNTPMRPSPPGASPGASPHLPHQTPSPLAGPPVPPHPAAGGPHPAGAPPTVPGMPSGPSPLPGMPGGPSPNQMMSHPGQVSTLCFEWPLEGYTLL